MKNIFQMLRFLLVLFATVNMTACMELHHYPTDWEKPQNVFQDGCADITGDFHNYGINWKGVNVKTDSLDMVFWSNLEKGLWENKLKATHITIEQSGEVLKISAWRDNKLIARKELRKGEKNGYKCTAEGINIEDPNYAPLLGYYGSSFTLFKTTDNALISKADIVAIGLIYVIPAAGGGTYWHRYPSYKMPVE
jgi:hypothetical protein